MGNRERRKNRCRGYTITSMRLLGGVLASVIAYSWSGSRSLPHERTWPAVWEKMEGFVWGVETESARADAVLYDSDRTCSLKALR